MAFAEDPTAFLSDFGVTVTSGQISGLGILDSPGEYVAGDRVITDEYVLKVERSRFGDLGYNDVINVDSEQYVVREAPLAVDDGVFCVLLLSKVAPGNVPTPEKPITEVRIDTATIGVIYVGQALHGASESSPVWTITRSTYSAAGVRLSKLTATGVSWTGRAGHTYT